MLIIGNIGFADRNILFGCRDLSEVDARVEAGLSLFVQRVLHRARLELLLRPESLLLVEHLAELAQIHLGHTTHSLMPSGNLLSHRQDGKTFREFATSLLQSQENPTKTWKDFTISSMSLLSHLDFHAPLASLYVLFVGVVSCLRSAGNG